MSKLIFLFAFGIPLIASSVTYTVPGWFQVTTPDYLGSGPSGVASFTAAQLDSYTFQPTSPNITFGPVVFEWGSFGAHVVAKYGDALSGTTAMLGEGYFSTDLRTPGTFTSPGTTIQTLRVQPVTVNPEPATVGLGLAGLAALYIKRKRAA